MFVSSVFNAVSALMMPSAQCQLGRGKNSVLTSDQPNRMLPPSKSCSLVSSVLMLRLVSSYLGRAEMGTHSKH